MAWEIETKCMQVASRGICTYAWQASLVGGLGQYVHPLHLEGTDAHVIGSDGYYPSPVTSRIHPLHFNGDSENCVRVKTQVPFFFLKKRTNQHPRRVFWDAVVNKTVASYPTCLVLYAYA